MCPRRALLAATPLPCCVRGEGAAPRPGRASQGRRCAGRVLVPQGEGVRATGWGRSGVEQDGCWCSCACGHLAGQTQRLHAHWHALATGHPPVHAPPHERAKAHGPRCPSRVRTAAGLLDDPQGPGCSVRGSRGEGGVASSRVRSSRGRTHAWNLNRDAVGAGRGAGLGRRFASAELLAEGRPRSWAPALALQAGRAPALFGTREYCLILLYGQPCTNGGQKAQGRFLLSSAQRPDLTVFEREKTGVIQA
jgi:hypothetical protein